jgi:hypothetical protein
MPRTDEEVDRVMELLPPGWRRWCPADGAECGCSGCALVPMPYLRAGLSLRDRLTKEEVEGWLRRQQLSPKRVLM